MRSSGVPGFPDPNSQGVIVIKPGSGIDQGSPQFQTAQRICKSAAAGAGNLSPAERPQSKAQALRFSSCMRRHGVTNFPDPNASGGHAEFNAGGIDHYSPVFQQADRACRSLLPGLPTPGQHTTT
jgi:hypothetical protein